MDHHEFLALRPSQRRKLLQEEDSSLDSFPLDEVNQDLLERILSSLSTPAFFRLSSVCKRWKSVANSPSFKLACSAIPSRDPWFYMVGSNLNQSVVFDSGERRWRKLNCPPLVQQSANHNFVPVAASGGLVCYRSELGNFIMSNPVTGSCRELPPLHPTLHGQSLHAIAMATCLEKRSMYKVVLIYGELPKLSCVVYDSSRNCWEEEILLRRKAEDQSLELDSSGDNAMYFLSTTGNVVVTDMQRSPTKQYSSVITHKNGEDIVYFLSSSGTIISCNLTHKCFSEYPRLLPLFLEYSIDVVECEGEMLVVVLSEFFESASLRVWSYDEEARSWSQINVMPPAMSHEFYGKKVDINCVGAGDQILVCLNSTELFCYVLCDLGTNQWVELPKRYRNGEAVEFMSAFSFEPRIEASIW